MATLATFLHKPLAQAAAADSGRQTAFITPEEHFRLRALPNDDVFLFSKHIDNSRVVREANPRARRGEWSFIGVACLLAALLMAVLYPRVANIVAGYQLQSLKQEEQRLLDEARVLDVMEARVSRQENLQALAKKGALGTPEPGQVVHLDPKGDARLALNRR
jgi:hypothetical protein